MTYLDYNATAPVHDLVRERMMEALAVTGNPSSVHAYGRETRQLLEQARRKIASAVGATSGQVIFTSGGTEANALAYHQHERLKRLVSAVEHPSGVDGDYVIAVDAQGRIDVSDLRQKLSENEISFVSIMAANNETGVIQDIIQCGEIAREFGARIHVDAVQMLCKGPTSIAEWDVDSISISAHKIGGPKGIGALIIRDGLPINPMIAGGGQELRRRGGTENLSAICGFAAALEAMEQLGDWQERAAQLRDYVEDEILKAASGSYIYGREARRICNTSAILMPGVKAETQLMAFDLAGIAVSAGSACSSGKVAASPVLKAMGASDANASATIRLSLGWCTTKEEVDHFLKSWLVLFDRTRTSAA